MRNKSIRLFSMAILSLAISIAGTAQGQTVVRPGFNIFSIDQDVEIGRQSAAQVEQQLPMMSDARISRYVSDLGAKLAAQAPGPKFVYQFKVVNSPEINAFALPGGFIYVNRGLLEAVRTEGELSGVVAHEISHVALRHPTNQASKAYLAQAGFGVLGGILGGQSQSSTGQIVGAVGGFGLNTLFLKFSRSMESQADIVGSQIMSRAGYDPLEMAHFFNFLGQQTGGNRGAVATFLSDHPAPANREARVLQEAKLLGTPHAGSLVGNLAAMQAQSRRLPRAPTTQLAQSQTSPVDPQADAGLSIERPSTQYHVFQQADGMFQIDQPDNWSAYVPSGGYGVTIVPRGGFATASNGRQDISYGVIVNHYVPFEGSVGTSFTDPNGSLFGHTSLEEATSDLIRHIMEANPYLARVTGSERTRSISGVSSFSVELAGRGQSRADERVTVVSQMLPDDHIIYMLLIAPAKDAMALAPTFDRMTRSLRMNNAAVHN